MTQDIPPPQKKKEMQSNVETRQGVILSIDSGLLSGSERFIDKPSFLIGSGTDADIILLDEGIAPVHLVVSITRSMLGVSVSIHALGDGIILGDRVLAIDETTHSQNELQLNLAGVDICIEDAKGYHYKQSVADNLSDPLPVTDIDGKEDHLRSESNWSAPLALAALTCLGLGIIPFTYDFNPDGTEGESTPGVEFSDEKNRDNFIVKLKKKMKEVKLDTLLNVQKKAPNGIEITGQLRKGYTQKWVSVLHWYDAQQNPPLLFNQVSKAADSSDLPSIKYVWFGKAPYIVLQDNQRVTVGQTINSNWKVETIDAKGIALSQADNRVLLKFE